MKALNRRSIAALGIAGMIAAGAAIPALAQDGSDEPEITEDTTVGELRELREERAAARQQEFAAALAEELGLDAATVDEAITTVREQRRAERREAAENGELRWPGRGRGHHGGGI